MTDHELPAYAAAIRRARAERGWSRGRLAYELEQVIRRGGTEPPARESLIRMIRAWENGEHMPDGYKRERLTKALGGAVKQIDLGPATATPLAPSSRELKIVELMAWVSDHSSLSFQEVYGAIATRVEQLHAQPPANRYAEAHRHRQITREDIAKALVTYYHDASPGGENRAMFYRACVGGVPLTMSVMVQRGWLGTSVRLGSDQERFRLADLGVATPTAPLEGPALEAALLRLASVEVCNTVLINNPLYRLITVNIAQRRLEATVAVAEFADYALTMDLLETELVNALTANTPQASSDADLAGTLQLPLRDTYLPTVASALAFDKRLCMGGPVALLAAARGSTRYGQHEPDYVVLIQERSARVLNGTGRLAVVPKAFHEPTIEAIEEVCLSASLEREFEEELLGREDLEGLAQSSYRLADPLHPNRLSEPMQWLLDRRQSDAYRVECVGFGINMVTGNYEFPCLIMIDDDEWWGRYGGQVEANWEMERIRRYSSRDTAGLQALATDPRWSNEGLFAFIEGLRRLGELGNVSRLALPKIELEA
jgi:transcriptional regulator with XRE-family HTH domain